MLSGDVKVRTVGERSIVQAAVSAAAEVNLSTVVRMAGAGTMCSSYTQRQH